MTELTRPLGNVERNLFHEIGRIIRTTLHAIGLIEAGLRNVWLIVTEQQFPALLTRHTEENSFKGKIVNVD